MKKEDFNQWDGFEKTTIPHGKTIVLQVIGIVDDPIPENKGQKIIPNVNIRPTCTIFRDGKTYNMAAIESVDVLGGVTLSHIFFSGASGGVIRLRSGNPTDERWWKYLSICDENESNPNRNINIEAKFKVLDEEKESGDLISEAKKINDAKTLILSSEDSVVNAIGKALDSIGVNTNDTRLKLLKLAEKKAGEIIAANESKVEIPKAEKDLKGDLLAPIKKAVKDGLFKVDKETQKVTFTGDSSFEYSYFGKFNEQGLLGYLKENRVDIIEQLS